MAAVSVGLPPAEYQTSGLVQERLEPLRNYLVRGRQSQTLLDRVILLWASTRITGLLTTSDQKAIISEALSKQQPDGGFSISAFVGNWKRHDNTALETKSDGYATGLVTFVLQPNGLIDLMKMGVERPAALVDVSRLPLNTIEEQDGATRIGAMTTNTDCAIYPLIRTRYPVLSQAILAGATQQLRNKATMGRNLLQQTRCYYFCDPAFRPCNKRNPGSGCSAIGGENRIQAIVGASQECITIHFQFVRHLVHRGFIRSSY